MMAVMNTQDLNSDIFQQRPPHVSGSEVDYKLQEHRLSSFVNNWPIDSPLAPVELSAAGFYYTGPGDRVQCAWCRGGLYNWEAGDIAISEHKRHFPKCQFIEGKLEEMIRVKRTLHKRTDVLENNKQEDTFKQSPSKAVEIVKQMGYDEDIVFKAVQKVQYEWGKTLNSNYLIDAIYEIEAEDLKLTGACNIDNETVLQQHIPTSNTVKDSQKPKCNNQSSQISKNLSDNKCSAKTNTNDKKNTSSLFSNTNDDIKVLQEENKRLLESKTCKICLDNEVNLLLLPCRHLVCCEQCGDSVKYCPVCRTGIVATVKTYLG